MKQPFRLEALVSLLVFLKCCQAVFLVYWVKRNDGSLGSVPAAIRTIKIFYFNRDLMKNVLLKWPDEEKVLPAASSSGKHRPAFAHIV